MSVESLREGINKIPYSKSMSELEEEIKNLKEDKVKLERALEAATKELQTCHEDYQDRLNSRT